MFLTSESLIKSAFRKNTHQLNRTISFILLSNHTMAAKVSLPRKPLIKGGGGGGGGQEGGLVTDHRGLKHKITHKSQSFQMMLSQITDNEFS